VASGLLSPCAGPDRDDREPGAAARQAIDDKGEVMIRDPWYLRLDFWMWVGVIFVPFFWLLPLGRFALARVAVHRDRRL
jgi:hypothetical protein